MADNYLVVYHYLNDCKRVYKRSIKGYRKVENDKNFTIIHQQHGNKSLLFEDGKNMASPYYLTEPNVIARVPTLTRDAQKLYITEVYVDPGGMMYSDI